MRREEEEATIRLAKDPLSWSRWPLLPMKKRTGREPLLGYLFDEDHSKGYKVYEGNIWDCTRTGVILGEFATVEDMISDGWVVD
jgi:hypothetical protein